MPVYHFTIHAYRSWRPDHPRGYTKKNEGYLDPDPHEAIVYDDNANQGGVQFTTDVQIDLYHLSRQICDEEDWRFEAIAFDPSHMHIMVGWNRFIEWEWVQQRLKNLLATKMNRLRSTPGKRWFVRRHGAPRRVRDQSHYDHLIVTYFPDHPGLFWCRGMDSPRWQQ